MISLYLLHPALVHFPIALLIGSSVCALAYIHWRRMPELRILTWWMMIPGWAFLLLAILSGLVAQGGLPPDAPYRTLLNLHTTSGLLLAVLYADLLYRGWLHNSGQGKRRTDERDVPFLARPSRKWALTIELLLGVGLVILSGWLGGQLVYDWGVNVIG